jgi:hypothetical protein
VLAAPRAGKLELVHAVLETFHISGVLATQIFILRAVRMTTEMPLRSTGFALKTPCEHE